MHAQKIIQDLLNRECPQMHSKRRHCLATVAGAGSRGQLSLMGMSRALDAETPLCHRIKRCDRLLGNANLFAERSAVYRAMVRRILSRIDRPAILVDWSDLLKDCSQHVLRAALVVRGRALVVYEEVHPENRYASPMVHKKFLATLKAILPSNCRPTIITDAGFRAPWFKALDAIGFDWIGRIRNRDMVRPAGPDQLWFGAKLLYRRANKNPKDLGAFEYVRSNHIACRLVLIKKAPKGRHRKTASGARSRSAQSLAQKNCQTEPWLLAVSPTLAAMSASQVVRHYQGRMQIEQTFRDVKNPRWGLGLSHSQSRKPRAIALLLLIGALIGFALWLIGLSIKRAGYKVEYGSRKKSANTLSVLSLAKWWLAETKDDTPLTKRQIRIALHDLIEIALEVYL